MSRRLIPAKPRSKADIDKIALDIVLRYQPKVLHNGERFDIERFFEFDLYECVKVNTDYQPLAQGIHGYTDSEELISVISVDLLENPLDEYFCRSTMAHETGHALLHVWDFRRKKSILRSIHNKDHVLRNYREEDIVLYKNPEWQAWRFAGSLLMPEQAFIAAYEDGLAERGLSERFGVNPAFIRSRAKALGIKL